MTGVYARPRGALLVGLPLMLATGCGGVVADAPTQVSIRKVASDEEDRDPMGKRTIRADDGKEKFTVYLPRPTRLALLQRALDESAAEGRRVSATEIVERLITDYLARKGGKHGRT